MQGSYKVTMGLYGRIWSDNGKENGNYWEFKVGGFGCLSLSPQCWRSKRNIKTMKDGNKCFYGFKELALG